MTSTCAQLEVAIANLEAKLNGPQANTGNYLTHSDLALIQFGPAVGVSALAVAVHIFGAIASQINKLPGGITGLGKVIADANQLAADNLIIKGDVDKARIKADAAFIKANIATNIANSATKKANDAIIEANDVRKIANFAIKEANKANLEAKNLKTSINQIVIDLNKQAVDLKKQETALNKAVSQFNIESKKTTAELTKQDKDLIKSQKLAKDAYDGYVVNKSELSKIDAYNKSNYTYLQKEYQRVNTLVTQANTATNLANAAKADANKATLKANQAIADIGTTKISVGKAQSDSLVAVNTSKTALTTAVNLQNNLPTIIGSYIKSTPTLIPISISQASQNIQAQFNQIKTNIQNQLATVQTNIQNQLSAPQKTFEAAQKSINQAFKGDLTQLEQQVASNNQVNQQAIPILNQIANSVAQQNSNPKAPTVAEIAAGILPEIQAVPNATVGALFPPLAAGQGQILQAINSKPSAQQNAQAILPEIQAVPAATVGALYPPIAAQLTSIQNTNFTAPTVAQIAAGILPEIQAVPAATVSAMFPPIAGQLTAVSQDIANLKSTVITLPDETATKIKAFIPPAALPAPDYSTGIAMLITLATAAVAQTTPTALSTAAATGVCSTTAPGGCSANLASTTASGINAHTSATGAATAAATAAHTGLLTTIISRIGPALPGGLSGAATRLSTSLGIDRALNLINFASNLHNAAMLTTSLKDTLLATLSSVGNATGLLQDAEGGNIDLNTVFNQGIEQFMILLLGQQTYTQLELYLKKYNKIYQAGANVMNSVQSMMSSLANVVETSAEYTGRIGNALMAAGAVGERAYAWMAERQNARISKFLQYGVAVGSATVILSAINEIAEEVVEGQEAKDTVVKETKKFKDELELAKRDPGVSNKEVEKAIGDKKAASAATPTGKPDEGLFSFLTN